MLAKMENMFSKILTNFMIAGNLLAGRRGFGFDPNIKLIDPISFQY